MNEIMPSVGKGLSPEIIMLNDKSQTQKTSPGCLLSSVVLSFLTTVTENLTHKT